MLCAEDQSRHACRPAPDASSPSLEALGKARDLALEVELWERSRGYAKLYGSDGSDGLIEHLYHGLRHYYDHDARYRWTINSLAAVRLMDATASRPADMRAQ